MHKINLGIGIRLLRAAASHQTAPLIGVYFVFEKARVGTNNGDSLRD